MRYFEIECAAKVMSLMTLSILFTSYDSYVVVHSAWRLVQCSLASDVCWQRSRYQSFDFNFSIPHWSGEYIYWKNFKFVRVFLICLPRKWPSVCDEFRQKRKKRKKNEKVLLPNFSSEQIFHTKKNAFAHRVFWKTYSFIRYPRHLYRQILYSRLTLL